MFLGIDVSTTATKALLLDESGAVTAIGRAAHSLQTPRIGWSEQDPEEWWQATQLAIAQALTEADCPAGSIQAIGLSGQMHGLVALDEDNGIIRPAILWNDGRSDAECQDIRNTLGLASLVGHTGNDAFPGFTAPKLLWMRKHEPQLYERIAHVILPKDYIRWRLSDVHATDRAGAGGTLLLDIHSRDWSTPVLEALDIPRPWLPTTHEGTQVTGTVSAGAARATGLKEGTPIVAGGGDQAAQAVGVGATNPRTFALTIGTSGVVFAPSAQPVIDPKGRIHAFPHALPDMWHVMGVMLSAAGSLQWFRDTLASEASFDTLMDEAANVPAGAEGVHFLPYLSGERTPHADPSARGAFTGLSLAHSRGHLTRAVLEGVAYGLKDNLNLLAASGIPSPDHLRASGGAMQSPLWRQILADVLDIPLVSVDANEGAALGAAMLAGIGAGHWDDAADATQAAVHTGATTEPNEQAASAYRDGYERFKELYPVLHGKMND